LLQCAHPTFSSVRGLSNILDNLKTIWFNGTYTLPNECIDRYIDCLTIASTRLSAVANVTQSTSQPSTTFISPASAAEMRVYIWLNVISKMLVFVSCCINPVIYGLLNHNYSQSPYCYISPVIGLNFKDPGKGN